MLLKKIYWLSYLIPVLNKSERNKNQEGSWISTKTGRVLPCILQVSSEISSHLQYCALWAAANHSSTYTLIWNTHNSPLCLIWPDKGRCWGAHTLICVSVQVFWGGYENLGLLWIIRQWAQWKAPRHETQTRGREATLAGHEENDQQLTKCWSQTWSELFEYIMWKKLVSLVHNDWICTAQYRWNDPPLTDVGWNW